MKHFKILTITKHDPLYPKEFLNITDAPETF